MSDKKEASKAELMMLARARKPPFASSSVDGVGVKKEEAEDQELSLSLSEEIGGVKEVAPGVDKKKKEDEAEMELVKKWVDSQDEVDFQALSQLQHRLGYMWQRRFHTDVVFLVGEAEEPIEAHRLILASTSPIFEQLLYEATPLLIHGKFILYESDFDTLTFKVFLKILYTNEIPLCLPLRLSLEVYEAGKKYGIGHLQERLLVHIAESVSIPNVFEALGVSTKTVELTHLIGVCWRLIEGQTKAVLEWHADSISLPMLIRILDRPALNMDEGELFKYVVKWSSAECKKRGVKASGKSKRELIDPLIKRLRIPSMPIALFHDVVVPSRLLTSYEVNAIYDYMKHPTELNAKALPYKLKRRGNPGSCCPMTPFQLQPNLLQSSVSLPPTPRQSKLIKLKGQRSKAKIPQTHR